MIRSTSCHTGKSVARCGTPSFGVDDADSLYKELVELVAAGAKFDYGLGTKPYGILEFGIQDLDGHDIRFGQRI